MGKYKSAFLLSVLFFSVVFLAVPSAAQGASAAWLQGGQEGFSVTQLHQNYDDRPHRYRLSYPVPPELGVVTSMEWSINCGYFVGDKSGEAVEWRYDTPGECADAVVGLIVTTRTEDGGGSRTVFSKEVFEDGNGTTPGGNGTTSGGGEAGRVIVYDGKDAVLKKGANGVSVVEFPGRDDVVVLDASGKKLGVSTKGVQKLVLANPINLSILAGVYVTNQSQPRVQRPTPAEMIDRVTVTVFYLVNPISVSVDNGCLGYCNVSNESADFVDFRAELVFYARKSCAQVSAAKWWLKFFRQGLKPNFRCEDLGITYAMTVGICNARRQIELDNEKLDRLEDFLDDTYRECVDGIEIECESSCSGDANAYVRAPFGVVSYSYNLHLCPGFCNRPEARQRTILHELTHYGGTGDTGDDLNAHNLEFIIPKMAEQFFASP